MTALRMTFALVAMVLPAAKALTCELALTMQVHSDRIVFGDPLYVEVTVANHGEHPVSVPPPDLVFGTLWFSISDVTGSLSCRTPVGSGAVGILGPRVLRPGERVSLSCSVAMPKFADFDEPLIWKPLQQGGSVVVHAEYMPWFWQALREEAGAVVPQEQGSKPCGSYRKLFVSAGQYVRIEPRPESELRVMRAWAEKRFPQVAYQHWGRLVFSGWPLGPELPGAIPNRFELQKFAREARLSGELGDWLQVHCLLQDAYAAHPAIRDEANRKLIGWLTRTPDFLQFFGGPEDRMPDVTTNMSEREMLKKWHNPPAHEYLFRSRDRETFVRVRYDVELKRRVLARELYMVANAEQVLASTAKALSSLAGLGDDTAPCGKDVRGNDEYRKPNDACRMTNDQAPMTEP